MWRLSAVPERSGMNLTVLAAAPTVGCWSCVNRTFEAFETFEVFKMKLRLSWIYF